MASTGGKSIGLLVRNASHSPSLRDSRSVTDFSNLLPYERRSLNVGFRCSLSCAEIFSHCGDPKLPHICLPWPCLGSHAWKTPGLQKGVAAYHTPCLEEGGRGPVEKVQEAGLES